MRRNKIDEGEDAAQAAAVFHEHVADFGFFLYEVAEAVDVGGPHAELALKVGVDASAPHGPTGCGESFFGPLEVGLRSEH